MKKILIITILLVLPAWAFSQAITLDPQTSLNELKVERKDFAETIGTITGKLGIHSFLLNAVVLSSNNFPLLLSTDGGSNNFDFKINPGGDVGIGHNINAGAWSGNLNSTFNNTYAKLHVDGVSPRVDGIPYSLLLPMKPSVYALAKPRSGETMDRNIVGVLGATNGGHTSVTGGVNIGVVGIGSMTDEPQTDIYNFYSRGEIKNNKSLYGLRNRVKHTGTGELFGITNEIVAEAGHAHGIILDFTSKADNKNKKGIYNNVINNAKKGSSYGFHGLSIDNANLEADTYGVYSQVELKSTKTYPGFFGLPTNYRGYGVYGDVYGSTSANKYGVYGRATGNNGSKYGVYGIADGTGGTKYGVYGATSGTGGTDYAGYFSGAVEVTGSLSKGSGSFKIDHPLDPENKYLYHSFVESPDMMNIYNGNVVTDASGTATVELPTYFDALNRDFRYQLTTIGQRADAWIAEEVSGNNQFKISTDKPNVKVSWMITGIRQDAHANANRIIPEVDKPQEEKGKYLDPEAFGKAKTLGMGYFEKQEMNKSQEMTKDETMLNNKEDRSSKKNE